MKKYILILFLVATMSIGAFAANKVNLITNKTDILQSVDAEFENGVFSMLNPDKAYLANFSVPGLKNDYVWSGDITVIDFGGERGPEGIRFCVGYDVDTGDFLNLIVTKSIGGAAERRGPSPLSDVYKLSKENYNKVLVPGSKFHFEITKKGTHVILKIDNVTAIDYVFPDEFDFFTNGDDYNLGFYAEKCSYEVRNLTVYSDGVTLPPVITATPKPVVTAKPTETPKPTESTENTTIPDSTEIIDTTSSTVPEETADVTIKPTSTTVKADTSTDKKDSTVSPLIIGVAVVTGLLVAATVVILIIRKKKQL